jgi:hypothetical protein
MTLTIGIAKQALRESQIHLAWCQDAGRDTAEASERVAGWELALANLETQKWLEGLPEGVLNKSLLISKLSESSR